MDACRGIMWKTCTRVRWVRLDSLIVIVLSGFTLARLYMIRIFTRPSEMGEGLIAESKCRKFNFILCCYDNYMDGIDYFVVKAYC
jgi:hypothetical protein